MGMSSSRSSQVSSRTTDSEDELSGSGSSKSTTEEPGDSTSQVEDKADDKSEHENYDSNSDSSERSQQSSNGGRERRSENSGEESVAAPTTSRSDATAETSGDESAAASTTNQGDAASESSVASERENSEHQGENSDGSEQGRSGSSGGNTSREVSPRQQRPQRSGEGSDTETIHHTTRSDSTSTSNSSTSKSKKKSETNESGRDQSDRETDEASSEDDRETSEASSEHDRKTGEASSDNKNNAISSKAQKEPLETQSADSHLSDEIKYFGQKNSDENNGDDSSSTALSSRTSSDVSLRDSSAEDRAENSNVFLEHKVSKINRRPVGPSREHQTASASKIQRKVRKRQAKASAVRRKQQQHKAATRIQATTRGHRARRKSNRSFFFVNEISALCGRIDLEEDATAGRIENKTRRERERKDGRGKKVTGDKNGKMALGEQEAARRIQREIRQHWKRRYMHAARRIQSLEEDEAARLIQRKARQRRDRRHQEVRHHQENMRNKERFPKKRAAAIRIQREARRKLAKMRRNEIGEDDRKNERSDTRVTNDRHGDSLKEVEETPRQVCAIIYL